MNIAITRIENKLSEEDEQNAECILVVDANGAISCTKNRHGEIGVVSTQFTPELLLEWVRSQCRYETRFKNLVSMSVASLSNKP